MFIKKRKITLVYASKYSIAFKKNGRLHLIIIIYIAIIAVLSIKPVDRFQWWLENSVSFIVVLLLVGLYKKYRLTNSSYICILILLVLHAIGAHYTYSICPIGAWMKLYLGFKRNNFDRLVSLVFGLLMALPVMEVLYHRFRLRYIQACVLSSSIILSICAIYELIQMLYVVFLSAEQAAVLLGIQGDLWDSQKDMAFGLLGSVITMGGRIVFKLNNNNKIHIVKK